MGHVLLGPDRHSSKGIMRPKCRKKGVKLALRGELLLTRSEAKRIRTQVLKRIRAEQEQRRTGLESVLSSVRADLEPEVKVLGNNFAAGNGKFLAAAYGS